MSPKNYLIAGLGAMILPLTLTAVLIASISGHLTEETAYAEEIIVEETEAVKTANIVLKRPIEKKEVRDESETELIELPIGDVEELTAAEEETIPAATEAELTPLYRCDGLVMDEDLQRFLYECLKEHGIERLFPYSIAQACQESEFDTTNVTGGLDCGLFQYRKTFWEETSAKWGYPGADIFNPYIQIDIYVHQMARRLNEYGCSIEEAISRHYTSDWGTYNAKYVGDVMSRYVTLERIR